MSAIVVVSSYGMPSAVKLQVACVRYYNGPGTKVIVIDDLSDRSPRVRAVCEESGAFCCQLPSRMGHYMGCQQSFLLGMILAKSRNPAPNVCFLSQRFMVTVPNWLANGELQLGKMAVLFGMEGPAAARTECIFFNTEMWMSSNNYTHFYPRSWNMGTIEQYLFHVLNTFIHPIHKGLWDLLGAGRGEDSGRFFSHHLPDAARRYNELADMLGVTLEADFHVSSHYLVEGNGYRG